MYGKLKISKSEATGVYALWYSILDVVCVLNIDPTYPWVGSEI